jgi:hypothetical protein
MKFPTLFGRPTAPVSTVLRLQLLSTATYSKNQNCLYFQNLGPLRAGHLISIGLQSMHRIEFGKFHLLALLASILIHVSVTGVGKYSSLGTFRITFQVSPIILDMAVFPIRKCSARETKNLPVARNLKYTQFIYSFCNWRFS